MAKKWQSEYLNKFPKISVCLEAFMILPKVQRRKFWLLNLANALNSFLDLLGLALVGVISSLAINGLTSNSRNSSIESILALLQLDVFDFEMQIVIIAFFAVILFIAKTLASMLLNRRILQFLSNHAAGMSSNLIRDFFNQNISVVRGKGTQETIYAASSGINSIALGVIGGLSKLISDVTLLMVLLVGLIYVDPISALTVTLMYSTVGFMIHRATHTSVQLQSKKIMNSSIEINKKTAEFIHAFREMYVKNHQSQYAEVISRHRFGLSKSEAELGFLSSVGKYLMEIVMILSICVLLILQLVNQSATQTIASAAVFIAASARILPAVVRIQQTISNINASISSAEVTFSILKETQAGIERNKREMETKLARVEPGSNEKPESSFEIECENIKFRYDKHRPYLLDDLTFTISRGEFVGIVGSTGSGKTTLIDILLGLHSTSSGLIKIRGKVPQVFVENNPGIVGYVPQDSYLIEGSLWSNLFLGGSDSGQYSGNLRSALSISRLEDVWDITEEGLKKFEILENGSNISGGQRQRIGLARALISQPQILILDEATSALDGVTEENIIENLLAISPGITIISVAHRISSLKKADKIFVLQNGRIESEGDFSNLRKRSHFFDSQVIAMGMDDKN